MNIGSYNCYNRAYMRNARRLGIPGNGDYARSKEDALPSNHLCSPDVSRQIYWLLNDEVLTTLVSGSLLLPFPEIYIVQTGDGWKYTEFAVVFSS